VLKSDQAMAASSKMAGRPPNMKGLLEPSVIRWHYSFKNIFFLTAEE
jgi:hypothetical protein